MIPRLPPLLLALLGGASIYGIKRVLDRLEPKVLGAPGSSEHYEKVYRFRRNVKKVGMATALTSVAFAGYYVYSSRQHRATPAAYSGNAQNNSKHHGAFYQDQYRERERRYAEERTLSQKKERERERQAKEQLEKEKQAMEHLISSTTNYNENR